MPWTVETLNASVDEEVAALPADMRARLVRLTELIEQIGFGDSVKHLEDGLWELRVTGRDGISRVMYVTATGRRMVILRVYIKKTQRTPLGELEIARRRAKEIR